MEGGRMGKRSHLGIVVAALAVIALLLPLGSLVALADPAPGNSGAADQGNDGNNGGGNGPRNADGNNNTGNNNAGNKSNNDEGGGGGEGNWVEETTSSTSSSSSSSGSGPTTSGSSSGEGDGPGVPVSEDCNGSDNSDTGVGANQGGPYDNTCPAGDSENGKGNGGANGRPCAGCVGNADDKNPPGQLPGPQDNNKGYECENPNKDGNNNGIGRGNGNPAHTGCQPQVVVNPPNPPNPPPEPPPPGGENPSGPDDIVAGDIDFGPKVLGTRLQKSEPEVKPGILPFTGGGIAQFLVIALGLMTVGALLTTTFPKVSPRRVRR